MRAFLNILVFVSIALAGAHAATATVRTSQTSGTWDEIVWSPSGVPVAGDTVIIASQVTDVPEGGFGRLIVSSGAMLKIGSRRRPTFTEVYNSGTISLAIGSMRVAGDLFNAGTIDGNGTVELTGAGGAIGGYGEFGNVFINVGENATAHLQTPVTFLSLLLGRNCRLLTGANDLVVYGSYASLSDFGVDGIVSTGGVVFLQGTVAGSARGTIRIGTVTSVYSNVNRAPTVNGVLGDPSGSVTFLASRRVGFSLFRGHVVIESGATVQAVGIGFSGRNVVEGSVTVRGTLTAFEEDHSWEIHGDLINTGSVEFGTIRMVGHDLVLNTVAGVWNPATRLLFFGDDGGMLSVAGELVVSRLTIGAQASGDSNIVVNMAGNPVRIRHRYVSDIARHCRLISDTVVRIWGSADGIADAQVVFEGFWDRTAQGRYGRAGKEVRFAAPRRVAEGTVLTGNVVQNPLGRFTLLDTLSVDGDMTLIADAVIEEGGRLVVEGALRSSRVLHGGGVLALTGDDDTLDVGTELGDSLRLEIGDGISPTIVRSARALRVHQLKIAAGSSFRYRSGDSVRVDDVFEFDIDHPQGNQRASTAADPEERRAREFFGNHPPTVYRYDNGYVSTDSVRLGEGYFVNFPAAATVTHRGGFANLPMTIPVTDGWNQIGAASLPAAVSRVTLSGVTLDSGFLDISNNPVQTLEPGRGYLLKVIGSGTITLHADP